MHNIKQYKIAFKALHTKMYRELHNYAKFILKNDEDAEEIIQDTFLAIWEKRVELSFDDSIRGYIIKTVKNKCLNKLQKKKIVSINIDHADEQRTKLSDGSQLLEEAELKLKITRSINMLPEKCKEIFLLSRSQNKTYKQIAEIKGISIKTVENQMGIALRKLRELLLKEK